MPWILRRVNGPLTELAHETDEQSRTRAPPPVIFAYFRLAWAKGLHNNDREERIETLGYLRTFANQLAIDIGIGERDSYGELILPDGRQFGAYTKLLARCHVALGEWQASLRDSSYMVSCRHAV